jgi:polyhydroxyalkanoate synthesis regulator phasin
MNESLRKMALLGMGIAALTREKAEQLADELVKKGEITEDESSEFIKDLMKRSEQQKNELEKKIEIEMKKAAGRLNLASKDDLKKLEKKIAALEKKKKK